MNEDYLKIFKSLSDNSRILIINSLLESPSYVELLSEQLDLSPSTVSFHLKKLEKAGLVSGTKKQYYTTYKVNEQLLNSTLRDLVKVNADDKNIQAIRVNDYCKKVIQSFFHFGKLTTIPVQQKKRRIVLEEISKSFTSDKNYTEKEVNKILLQFNDDFCTLRKGLIEEKLFVRDKSIYKKIYLKEE